MAKLKVEADAEGNVGRARSQVGEFRFEGRRQGEAAKGIGVLVLSRRGRRGEGLFREAGDVVGRLLLARRLAGPLGTWSEGLNAGGDVDAVCTTSQLRGDPISLQGAPISPPAGLWSRQRCATAFCEEDRTYRSAASSRLGRGRIGTRLLEADAAGAGGLLGGTANLFSPASSKRSAGHGGPWRHQDGRDRPAGEAGVMRSSSPTRCGSKRLVGRCHDARQPRHRQSELTRCSSRQPESRPAQVLVPNCQ